MHQLNHNFVKCDRQAKSLAIKGGGDTTDLSQHGGDTLTFDGRYLVLLVPVSVQVSCVYITSKLS
jgi:hypothetical protein